jgi:hypothetical protein
VFLHLYFAQFWQAVHLKPKSSFGSAYDPFNIDFLDVHMDGFGVKQSLGRSEYDEEGKQSEYGVSVRGSAMGMSVRGSAVRESVYGVSEQGSQIGISSYGVSERGSVKYSVEGSVYATS